MIKIFCMQIFLSIFCSYHLESFGVLSAEFDADNGCSVNAKEDQCILQCKTNDTGSKIDIGSKVDVCIISSHFTKRYVIYEYIICKGDRYPIIITQCMNHNREMALY